MSFVGVIVTEFVVDTPILRPVLQGAPNTEIRWEGTSSQLNGPTHVLAWISSDDFEAVEEAIEEGPSARDVTMMVDMGERRLYRMDFTEFAREVDLLPKIIEVGGVLEQSVGTEDGWWCQARFPDREAFQTVYQFCRDHEIGFEFERIFESPTQGSGDSILPMLTDKQREALECACNEGYFDIPRRTTMVELADNLGISDTALSQRLHRAQASICAYLFDTTN